MIPGTSSSRWLAVLGVLVGCAIHAETYDQGPVLTVLEENDLFVNTDRHYTQGIKISFLEADNHMPRLARWISDCLPAVGYDQRAVKFGFQIGQNMYTPADYSVSTLQPNDRPYAGWLYTGFIWQRRGRTADTLPTVESVQLDLGMIGPASLAREAQTWVHELRGFATPQGWGNQLHNEFGVALKYQRTLRLSLGAEESRWFDFLPHAGFSLGNVETSARLGVQLRLGWHLPDNFGWQNIESLMTTEGGRSGKGPNHNFGVFLFSGVEGKAVGYTAFLDGNLFESSHHVAKEPFVAEWRNGFGVTLWRLEGGFALVTRSRDFKKQDQNNQYGSLFLTMRF